MKTLKRDENMELRPDLMQPRTWNTILFCSYCSWDDELLIHRLVWAPPTLNGTRPARWLMDSPKRYLTWRWPSLRVTAATWFSRSGKTSSVEKKNTLEEMWRNSTLDFVLCASEQVTFSPFFALLHSPPPPTPPTRAWESPCWADTVATRAEPTWRPDQREGPVLTHPGSANTASEWIFGRSPKKYRLPLAVRKKDFTSPRRI